MDAFRMRVVGPVVNGNDYHGDYPVGLWDQMSERAQEACKVVARERLRKALMELGVILTDAETAVLPVTIWRLPELAPADAEQIA